MASSLPELAIDCVYQNSSDSVPSHLIAELWYEAVVMFITGVTVFGSSLLFFHRREQ